MNILELKKNKRQRRKFGIRKKIYGSPERYRLTIFRSLNHIYAQIVDDDAGKTLVAASTLEKEVIEGLKPGMKKIERSKLVGAALAKKAIDKDIKKVTFDRNGYLYHGRVKALADAARQAGLEF